MTATTTPKVQAAEFAAACQRLGFSYDVNTRHGDPIITVERHFTPGDRDAYIECDGLAFALIAAVPTVTYGSTWGTDGGSVGRHAGLTGGYYRLSRSGVSKRFAAALAKVEQ